MLNHAFKTMYLWSVRILRRKKIDYILSRIRSEKRIQEWLLLQFDRGITLTFRWPWPNLWSWFIIRLVKENWCPGNKFSIFKYDLYLDLDPRILLFKLGLVMMYHHTKNEVCMLIASKVTTKQTYTVRDSRSSNGAYHRRTSFSRNVSRIISEL